MVRGSADKGVGMNTATLDGTFTFTDLEPDQVVEFSANYKPDDGTTGRNNGLNQIPANENGVWKITLPVGFLTGGKHTPGNLRAWLRAAGTAQTAPPILDVNGLPAEVTLRVV